MKYRKSSGTFLKVRHSKSGHFPPPDTPLSEAPSENSHWVAKERGNWNSFTNMVILQLSPLRTSYLEFSELGNIFCKPNLLWGFKNHFNVKVWKWKICISCSHIQSMLNSSPSKYCSSCLSLRNTLMRNQKRGLLKTVCQSQLKTPRRKKKRRGRGWKVGYLALWSIAVWGHVPLVSPTPNGWL